MDEHIYKSHNKSLLLYHIVCPAKYRRKVFSDAVEKSLKEICIEIEKRYEIRFFEIGVDEDHVHFLIQSVPMMSISKIVKTVKGITGRMLLKKHKGIEKVLWGGNLWTSGYYANTVGSYGTEEIIQNYVKKQGKQYKKFIASNYHCLTI